MKLKGQGRLLILKRERRLAGAFDYVSILTLRVRVFSFHIERSLSEVRKVPERLAFGQCEQAHFLY